MSGALALSADLGGGASMAPSPTGVFAMAGAALSCCQPQGLGSPMPKSLPAGEVGVERGPLPGGKPCPQSWG